MKVINDEKGWVAMKNLISMMFVFFCTSVAQGQPATILKCINPEGQVSFHRSECPEGLSGEPSNDWVRQPWIQEFKAELQESMDQVYGAGKVTVDDRMLVEEVDAFYPDWTEIGFQAAEHGLTLQRIKRCVENQEYTSDPRPGIAAEGCISHLSQSQ
jgi:hypothetical protein